MKKNLLFSHSRPLDVHRASESTNLQEAIEQLLFMIVDKRKSAGRRIRDLSGMRAHLKVLVLDLYTAYTHRPFYYIGLSRSPKSYSGEASRYQKLFLSFNHTIGILDDLVALGYVKQWKGFYDRGRRFGLQTRIRARRPLVDLVECFGGKPEMVQSLQQETVRLKDTDGNYLEYEDTDETNQMRENLKIINDKLSKTRIRLFLPDSELYELSRWMAENPERGPIDYSKVSLHRVFNNGSFEQGGRFYGGWWQTVPREYRVYLDINYKPTIEVDFSGLHIRMLYGQMGAEVPGDPYDLEEYPREIQKQALVTLINADSEDSAERSLRGEGIKGAKELIRALKKRHSPIQEHFLTGVGVKLQYLDSRLAERVMLETIKLGGMALPVHDSFIVRIGREKELETVMAKAFSELFPQFPSLTHRKKTFLEIDPKSREEEVREEQSEPFVTSSVIELGEMHDQYRKYWS